MQWQYPAVPVRSYPTYPRARNISACHCLHRSPLGFSIAPCLVEAPDTAALARQVSRSADARVVQRRRHDGPQHPTFLQRRQHGDSHHTAFLPRRRHDDAQLPAVVQRLLLAFEQLCVCAFRKPVVQVGSRLKRIPVVRCRRFVLAGPHPSFVSGSILYRALQSARNDTIARDHAQNGKFYGTVNFSASGTERQT